MKVFQRGISLIEILIATLVGAGLVSFVGQMLPRTLRANRVNQQATEVSQNAEVVAALLQLDVKDAGFRGGTDDSFQICATCRPTPDQVGNLLDIVKWPFTIDASNALSSGLLGIPDIPSVLADPLPILTHVSGSGVEPDALGFVRILEIGDATSNAPDIYRAEFILYTVDSDDRELVRLRQRLSCDGTSVTIGAGSECRLLGGNSGQQPAVNGVEDIQFFFKLRHEVNGQPVYTPTLPSNTSSVASVGIYTRARAELADPNHIDTAAYPDINLLPNGALAGGPPITDWHQLGVRASGPYDDGYRRVEKVQEIALRTSPACNLLPIAWPSSTIPAAVGDLTAVTHAPANPGPGNFGWLSWEGSHNVPTLVRSINHPSLASSTYRDPTNNTDSTLGIGSVVEGMPGHRQPGASALSQYIGIPIVVPLYSTFTGTGGNLTYDISGFASIVLDRSSTITHLSGTYLGEASATCTL